MNLQLISLAQKALQNKHTTGAAVAYAVATFGCPIAKAWWPSHGDAIDVTAKYLEAAAVFYGFAAAGDGSKSAQAHEETKQLVADLQNQISQVKQDTATATKPNP